MFDEKTGDEKSHDAVPLKQVKLGSAVMVLVWMRMLAVMALLWGGAGNGGASDDRASDSRSSDGGSSDGGSSDGGSSDGWSSDSRSSDGGAVKMSVKAVRAEEPVKVTRAAETDRSAWAAEAWRCAWDRRERRMRLISPHRAFALDKSSVELNV